jgi:pyruvate dehydrogenase E2 component (dihydrolipoamide acetyltransferase)
VDITMPQLGETVTEGTVTRWLKEVGDEVAPDDLLFEVSTDKVDSEVPSPGGGYLAEILVPEGETVAVGTKLAVLSDSPPGDGGSASTETKEKEAPEAEEKAEPEAEEKKEPEAEEKKEPEAEEKAEPEKATKAEPEEKEKAEPEPEEKPQPETEEPSGNGEGGGQGLLLSPVVRKLIGEHDLDPSQIEGTGEGGRITRNDVLAFIDRKGGATKAPAAEAPAKPAAEAKPEPKAAPAPAARAGADETVPFDNIRKRTAEHMVRSKQTSPHVLTAIEVDFERVERARAAAKEEWRAMEGFSLTYLPFIARAVCDAIAEYPNVNASVSEDALVIHRYVNLGIAVDLDLKGLIVPVIKSAEGKRLRLLAREMRDLAERARTRKLTPDDVVGGTFTITNPGPFGTFISAPVINQPQVAILSTDGVKKRPVVVEGPDGDAIAIHHVGLLAMSWDHRAIDGAYASAYLHQLKEIIETRDWEAELT